MLTPALKCRNLVFTFITFSILAYCLRLKSPSLTTDGLPSIGVTYCTAFPFVIAFGRDGWLRQGARQCDLSITDEPTIQKQQQSCITLGQADARRRMRGLHSNAGSRHSRARINLYSVLSIGAVTKCQWR